MKALLGALLAAMKPRASLVAENLALRQQLAVLRRTKPRPRLHPIDRVFWALLSQTWSRWVDVLAIVRPATVVGWHRCGFAQFWAMKSNHVGRPPTSADLIALIERIAAENPPWSRRRIAGELAKLGHDVSKDAVAKVHAETARPPGPAAVDDLGGIYPRTRRRNARNRLPHRANGELQPALRLLRPFARAQAHSACECHPHPHAAWAAQQMVEAVGVDATLNRVIRDRDGIYGKVFDARVSMPTRSPCEVRSRSCLVRERALAVCLIADQFVRSSKRLDSEPRTLVGAGV